MGKNQNTISGFLNLYKTSGPTSMDVLRQIKKLTGQKMGVGHGGTLDPLAEGVLPICFGQATRLMEYLVDSSKRYHMEVLLGVTTSTYDGEGEVVKRGDPSGLDQRVVEETLESFRGTIYQTPPMYSAIKLNGKRLYKLARAGIEVEREPRKVEISTLEIVEYAPPSLVLEVQSGRGAYMRSLGHDLGEALGCGGYLKSLVRLSSGPFRAEDAVRLDGLQEASDRGESWGEHLKPPDFLLLQMRGVTVGKAAERYLRNGQPVSLGAHVDAYVPHMERCRAYNEDGCFLGVLGFDKPRGLWRPQRVFNLETTSPYAPSVATP